MNSENTNVSQTSLVELLQDIQNSNEFKKEEEMFLNVENTILTGPIYIRSSYKLLFELIRAYLDKSIPLQSARLLGTPGIGKTCFGLVLIKLFLDQNITFVYDAMTYCQPINPILIRNGKIQTLDLNSRDIFKILRSEKLFYIVDGKPPILPISALKNVSTILICSPRTEYFKNFEKQVDNQRRMLDYFYLPLWTLEELTTANSTKYSQTDLETRFNLVGGVPRFIFSAKTEDQLISTISRAIKSCNLDQIFRCNDTDGLCDTMNHVIMIFNVSQDLRSFKSEFASDYIMNAISEEFESEILANFVKYFDSESKESHEYRNFKGLLYENVFTRYVTHFNTEYFEVKELVKDLSEGETSPIDLDIKPYSIKNPIVGKSVSIADRQLDERLSKSTAHEVFWKLPSKYPTFDYMLIDTEKKVLNLYQVTTNKNHHIKWTRKTNELIEKIDHDKSYKIKFYFAVPKSIGITIKAQSITYDDQSHKREVEQYALLVCIVSQNKEPRRGSKD